MPRKNNRKQLLSIIALVSLFMLNNSEAQGLGGLLTGVEWNTLFPKRAGISGVHPQGYNTDFYSYDNLNKAANEMADFSVLIQKKQGVWGELVTITKKSSNKSYLYSDVESWWHTNTTPITSIVVDFKDFLNTRETKNNKRELAAFLANISKETTGGWQLPVGGGLEGDYARWGLYFVHEVGYNSGNSAGVYSQASAQYPPNPAKGYYGRGPLQLSWNYNYGQFSKFLFNDSSILLNNPDTLQKDGVLAFKSAIWFWMMPQCPKPSCHQVMQDQWSPKEGGYASNKMYKKGFAHTNNIINGGLECRSSSTAAFTEKVSLRSQLYKFYLEGLGIMPSLITLEDSGDYSTLCFEGSTNTMIDYVNCDISIKQATAIKEVENKVWLHQSLSTNQITILGVGENFRGTVKILNISGQVIWTQQASEASINIPVDFLSKGIYQVQIISKTGNVINKKFIKE